MKHIDIPTPPLLWAKYNVPNTTRYIPKALAQSTHTTLPFINDV